MRLALRAGLCSLVLAGALYLFVYPARTYLAQRQEISSVQRTLSVLDAANAELSDKESELRQASYVEQVARAEYGLVMPGQQAFTVLPPAQKPAIGQVPVAGSPHTRGAKGAPWYAPLEFWDHF
jgi:cell division protein FtsB